MTAQSSHRSARYRLVPLITAVLLAAAGLTLAPTAAQATVPVPTVGVPSGTTLTTVSGDLTVTTANSVVDAKSITGRLIISAANVLVTRTRVNPGAQTGDCISISSGASATIVDSTVIGCENSVAGGNYTATRLDVSGMGADGFKVGSNVNLLGNYCHGMAPLSGAHPDCAQVQAGVTNSVIENNYFTATGPGGNVGSTALFVSPDLGPTSAGPLTVTGNYFDGGAITVQSVTGGGGSYSIGNVTFSGNRWGNTHLYGYENIAMVTYYDYTSNVRDDTGAGV